MDMKQQASSPNSPLPEGTVTFLFTDIEGSTKLLHRLGDKYISLLDDHHRILRGVFANWNGREVDTEGDAFFVSFPKATEAVAAVVEAQRTLAEHSWPEGVTVRVRMGLHTGEPWTRTGGYVGMDVHRAARIAHAGYGGQVLLSETTAALLRGNLPGDVTTRDLGQHRLKDMQFPEHIRQLVVDGLPSDFPPLKSLDIVEAIDETDIEPLPLPAFLTTNKWQPRAAPVFVGRDDEMTFMAGFLDTLFQEHEEDSGGNVLFVNGDAGSGKSALTDAFSRQALTKFPDLLVTQGLCNAFIGSGDPYQPFRSVMGMLTGDLESKIAANSVSREQVVNLWQSFPTAVNALATTGPDLIDVMVPGEFLKSRVRKSVPSNELLLQKLSRAKNQGRAAPGELNQSHLFDQYVSVLRILSTEHPILIILDDLQWADSGSINLLFHLARSMTGYRVLLIGAYRPEEIALGRDGKRHPLEPVLDELKREFGQIWIDLNTTKSKAFVYDYLNSEPNRLSSTFRQTLLEHTGGQALFTVETLRDLQERGDLIKNDEDYWVESPSLDWEQLPTRVEGVIEARVERLEEELRDVLSIAAVEGEDFTAQIIARIQDIQERKLLRTLSRELEKRHHLVTEQKEDQIGALLLTRYRFTHALFRQFLYNDLSAGERRLLHGEIADILEELYVDRLDEIAVHLARHYAEAEDNDKALPYILQAGDSARALYAFEEAIQHYQQALAIYKDQGDYERASRILMKLGLTYHSAFDYARSSLAYEESFTLQQKNSLAVSTTNLAPAQHPLRLVTLDVLTFEPGMHDDFRTARILDQLFSGLIRLTPDMNVVPDVAKSWEVLYDGQTYLFNLRDDVRWSDGEPVTAHDFILGWRRVLDPKNGSTAASILYDIRGAAAFHQGDNAGVDELGIKALDDFTLQIDLEQPSNYFLYILAHDAAFPVPGHVIASQGDAWTDLDSFVSNGSFRLESYQKGQLMILRRNPTYHGDFRGNLEAVHVHIVMENIAWAGDLVLGYDKDKNDILDFIHMSPVERPPFDDPRVRQAFVLATDRQTLAAVTEMGHISPATGGFSPLGMPGHVPGIALPFDLERARRLLAEAGYPGGEGFPKVNALIFNRGLGYFEALLDPWQSRLGVEISCENLKWSAFMQRIREESDLPHIHSLGWSADYPDPDSFMRLGVDALVERARRVMDQDERMRLYQEAEEIIVREAPFFPLYYGRRHLLIKPWIRNYRPNVIGALTWKDIIIDPH